ncbi:MAG: GyrI-like domain-containing protein, partial [Actinobacteria bacterium]|nr:GyrI-like domain-containing protein [Actinomycetota bacterium]
VAGELQPSGRLKADSLPGGDVATTTHTGAYEGLPGAFHAVTEWIRANSREIAGDPWESYLDGPEAAEPRTKVCFPLVAR